MRQSSKQTRWPRMAVGALHVPAGLWFLVMRPRLWPLTVLPVLLTAFMVVTGLALGVLVMPTIVEALSRHIESAPWFLRGFVWLGIAFGSIAAFTLFGFAIALALVGPVLERLSRRVEHLSRGRVADAPDEGLAFGFREAFKSSRYFLLRVPVVLLLGLVPVVGPVLGVLWTAHSLAFQQTDATLTRQGLSFEDRREWHANYRRQSVGFGLAGVFFLLIPVFNLLLMPTIVVGATRLALGLQDD